MVPVSWFERRWHLLNGASFNTCFQGRRPSAIGPVCSQGFTMSGACCIRPLSTQVDQPTNWSSSGHAPHSGRSMWTWGRFSFVTTRPRAEPPWCGQESTTVCWLRSRMCGMPSKFVEIGTFTGASALTFLLSESVERVVTFDVTPWDQVEGSLFKSKDFGQRLEQRLGNVAHDDVFTRARSTLQNADIIFVDAPKDGVFEYLFLPKLLALPVGKRQLIILDDVRLMPMVSLWRSVPLPKLDIGSFGHYSGTGILIRTEPVTGPLRRRRYRPPGSVRAHRTTGAKDHRNIAVADDGSMEE